MGCFQSHDLARSGTYRLVDQFRKKRDVSAPIMKKPIFDLPPLNHSPQPRAGPLQAPYYPTFSIPKNTKKNYYVSYRTGQRGQLPQQAAPSHPPVPLQSHSCPQRVTLSPAPYHSPNTYQSQRRALGVLDPNITFCAPPQPQCFSLQAPQPTPHKYLPSPHQEAPLSPHLGAFLTQLQNHQQQLFRTASNAVLNIENERLNTQDKKAMKDIFHKLEKSSFMESRRSSMCSLQQNSQQLQRLYEDMSQQLVLLNQLAKTLEQKMERKDSTEFKKEMQKFAYQLEKLNSLRNSAHFNQNFGEMHAHQHSEKSISSTQSKIHGFQQQYYEKNKVKKEQSPRPQGLEGSFAIQSSRINQSLSSIKMQENNKKIDNLIHKLHRLNSSYKKLTEDSEQDMSIELSNTKKQHFMKILGI